MINIADDALSALKKYEQAEVFVSEARIHTVYIDNSAISNVETKTDSGMMFRMIDKGRIAKASVTLNSPDSAAECIRMADSLIPFSPVNDKLEPLAQPGQAVIQRPDVFDRKADEVDSDGLREMGRRLIDACSSWNGTQVKIPRALIRVSTVRTRTVNSNGVDTEHECTGIYAHMTSMCVRDHPGEGISVLHGVRLDQDIE